MPCAHPIPAAARLSRAEQHPRLPGRPPHLQRRAAGAAAPEAAAQPLLRAPPHQQLAGQWV